MPLNDLTADRQSDTCSRVIIPAVQALKDDKHPFGILRVDSNSIVANKAKPFFTHLSGADVDAGGSPCRGI